MGSVTLYPNADVAIQTNNDYGAGAGPHLPVGVWSGITYRAGIRFTAPAWTGWTKITKATLNVWISDHAHVGVRNSTILCRRQPTDDMWTRGEGTYSCNSGFSSSNTTHLASDLTSSSTGEVSFTSGTTGNAKKSLNVTTIMQAYFAARTAQPVFLFLHNSTSDYTELWSRSAGSTYDPQLIIEYEDDTVPNAPTLNSPASGEVVASQNPTLSWTHNDPQGNPQVSAEVSVNGVNVYTVASEQSLQVPDALARGSSYDWLVRTADSLGYGAWSAARSMTIAGYVLPAITKNYLVWSSGARRYRMDWTWSPPDGRYATHHRVTFDGYDSGWQGGNPGYHVASTFTVQDNVPITNVTIYIRDSFGIESGQNFGEFKPRYGVVAYRKDLGAIPVSWGTPTVQATIPGESTLVIQYGSNSTPEIDPINGVWYESLSAVPKLQYLYYALHFLPNSSREAPTLHQITIPTSNTVETLDHWKKWQGSPFAPPWSLDSGEYVYGTRSVRCDPSTILDVWNPGLHSELIQLRAGRSYILSGLVKSEGPSGAHIALLTEAGQGGLANTEPIYETRDWFKPDNLDTYRYRSAVYTSPSDQKVYAYCVTNPKPSSSILIDVDNGATIPGWSQNLGAFGIEDGGGGIPTAGWGSFFVMLFSEANQYAIYTGNRLPVTTGKRYRMRALIHSIAGGVIASGGWFDSSGFTHNSGAIVLPDAAWAWHDFDLGVAPAGAASVTIAFNAMADGSDRWLAVDHVTIYEDYSATAWFDAVKLEESTVATPWSPGAVGASAVDAGGVQIDGAKGAVLRYRGRNGGVRDVVEGGLSALLFGSDTELASPETGLLAINGDIIGWSGENLCPNGGFRDDLTGWGFVRPSGTGANGIYGHGDQSWVLRDGDHHDWAGGSSCLGSTAYFTVPFQSGGVMPYYQSPRIPVLAGRRYSVSGLGAGHEVGFLLEVGVYDLNGSYVTSKASPAYRGYNGGPEWGGYKYMTVEDILIPYASSFIIVYFHAVAPVEQDPDAYCFLDQVMVVEGRKAQQFRPDRR